MKKVFLLFFLAVSLALEAAEIPRRIVTFWDSAHERLEDSLVANTSEMILNHLGFDVLYYDIVNPPPDISHRSDIAAILLCMQPESRAKDPEAFIDWLLSGIRQGIKVIVMRTPGFQDASIAKQNELYQKIGVKNMGQQVPFTFDYSIQFQDQKFFPYEIALPSILPSFEVMQQIQGGRSLLRVVSSEDPKMFSDLVVMGQAGAYVESNYESSFDFNLLSNSPRSIGWHINPFLFFKTALDVNLYPVPDTTTLSGRRLFYHIIHGDAWNIETSIEEFQQEEETYASEVLLEKVVIPNPDLPVAVGVIAADVNPSWVAKNKSREVALKYFRTRHVEMASHTYSHPFDWPFFSPGSKQSATELELDYLYRYRYPTWENAYLSWFHAVFRQYENPSDPLQKLGLKKELSIGYVTPRAYANEPFNVETEITGSIDYINAISPGDKKVTLLLWPGNGLAWGEAVELTYKAGVKNLGVGSTRYDNEFPSLIFVGPIGRRPGGWVQVYNSSNGENDYTYEWEKDFYRFTLLQETLKRTGSPIRLKPICLFYHSYSGEFVASINAVLKNLEYIRAEKPIAVKASRFCDVGYGFYTTTTETAGNMQWVIRNRFGLQTVRFDDASHMQVDFARSRGVIGYTTFEKNLYVALDSAIREAVVALKQENQTQTAPYLIDSSWEIWDFKRKDAANYSFFAKGWGVLHMNWFVPHAGKYKVTAISKEKTLSQVDQNTNGQHLTAELNLPYDEVIEIRVEKM